MSAITERGVLRWKEWMPLVTQQQRLRSLIQVIAYNIQVKDDILSKHKVKKLSYYFTLHLSTMSAPVYTSEKLESENPKWCEVNIGQQYGAATGVVIRLWVSINGEADYEVTVWGLFFSGLMYLGPRVLNTDPSALGSNSLIFHMYGGYFTSPHCFLNPHPVTPRTLTIQMNASHTKPSYNVNSLLRLQTLQQAIKKQTTATAVLRERISSGCAINSEEDSLIKGSAALRKLLGKPVTPKVNPDKILAIKMQIEMKKFRIQMLVEEKDRKAALVQKLAVIKDMLAEKNQDRDTELMDRYFMLRKNIEKRKEFRQQLIETRTHLAQTAALLDKRKKTLMSQLSLIYPIIQSPNGNYTIREVHLPDSEDFDGKDELMISVALGFVTHLVQMMSFFLNVPTRYPMVHFGSRSKIIDHISENISDKDREFPLYARGKEKHLFDYGVYLLNKNIAQLRWCCGITTTDLRPTLLNLSALMNLTTKQNEIGSIMREWNRTRTEEKHPSLSNSLDRGLDCVTDTPSDPNGSDCHEYVEKQRVRYESAPVHDLASLMSLDITCKSYDNINGSHAIQSYNKDQPMTVPNEDLLTRE
ncbi:UV radiation resistance associated protein [Cimex lectularius]|uniref:UV radiation resistance-associated gene protein n=1 Tax=Cimex lectularius TaxID=79782 RepID=A0A8I6THB1_CIMLE|nr:UV radiation resistance associated protein [Cimex lectularius]